MQLADRLAAYKINHLQLYIEHTFRFRGHPDIGKNASPLTAEDILTLDAFCRERHIELAPSLASFGHLATILHLPQYRHLAEDWGVGRYLDPKVAAMPDWQKHRAWSLAPGNPAIYRFLDSLFAELLPLFSSDRFNVCCDETWDMGMGQSYALARKIGRGPLYVNHILKLRELAAKYGKKIMVWGDMLHQFPELARKLPADVTVLDWGYEHNQKFERIAEFRKAGLPAFACPGTHGWCGLFPRLHKAAANIHGFAAAGLKHGARGLLNTDWGDNGHYNFMEYSWPGYLFGAEQSWNVNADRRSFIDRFCGIFLKTRSRELTTALVKLGDLTHTNFPGYYESIWSHVFFAAAGDPIFRKEPGLSFVARGGRIGKEMVSLDARLGRSVVRDLAGVRRVLVAHSRKPGADPLKVLPYWIFAVDTLVCAARKVAVLGRGGRDTREARRKLRAELTGLMKRFETLWMARNRRSEIRKTLSRYRAVIRSL
jgi:hexosaminidase